MGEVSGGPSLTGWVGGVGEGPLPQPRPQGTLLWCSKSPPHFTSCSAPPSNLHFDLPSYELCFLLLWF